MAYLYRIKVRCPVTTQVFDTGIRTTGREALTNNACRGGVVSCKFCNQFHSLDEDAFCEIEQSRQSDTLWRPNP